MYVYYNPNPTGRSVGDCAVRAVAKALDIDWEQAYALIALDGFSAGDMPSGDNVWGLTLKKHGFKKADCYTAEDFIKDHPSGTYVLGFGGHVATVKDGKLYDSWNSLREIPQFYWYKEE